MAKHLPHKFFILLVATTFAGGARILGLFPVPTTSHYILGSTLMRALAERGHDVTVVSPYGEKTPPVGSTYKDMVITGLKELMEEIMHGPDVFENAEVNLLRKCLLEQELAGAMMEKVLEHEDVQHLINSNETFDVVIIEKFYNDAHQALASRFGTPLILFTSIGPSFLVNLQVGNPASPSYIPDIRSDYSSRMSFSERIMNSLTYLFNLLIYQWTVYPRQDELAKKYIPDAPNLEDVIYNVSLVLLNSHPSINQPVPLVPNMIEIGGFHIKPPKKLPEDIQEFLDGAKDGVIYFSMGSNLRSASFSVEKQNAFTDTFAKLKQKVLWKFEGESILDQPRNVKVGKWLPQQDILAHSNVKLFITHGGLLSSAETIYHGVPVLSIPVYGDQHFNAKIAVTGGYGLTLPYREITAEKLLQTINTILNNPEFRQNAKRRSKIFHDRPVSPIETATYWIEYVLRHKGASHLRVAALNLPWYKYHLLDVIGLISFVGLLVTLATYIVLKKLFVQMLFKVRDKKLKIK